MFGAESKRQALNFQMYLLSQKLQYYEFILELSWLFHYWLHIVVLSAATAETPTFLSLSPPGQKGILLISRNVDLLMTQRKLNPSSEKVGICLPAVVSYEKDHKCCTWCWTVLALYMSMFSRLGCLREKDAEACSQNGGQTRNMCTYQAHEPSCMSLAPSGPWGVASGSHSS